MNKCIAFVLACLMALTVCCALATIIQVFNDMNTVKPENVPAA